MNGVISAHGFQILSRDRYIIVFFCLFLPTLDLYCSAVAMVCSALMSHQVILHGQLWYFDNIK